MASKLGEVLEQAATQIRRLMPVMMHALDRRCSYKHPSVRTRPSAVISSHVVILREEHSGRDKGLDMESH